MNKYEKKFEDVLNEKYIRGQRNTNRLAVIAEGRRCGIPKDDIKSLMRACHRTDELSEFDRDFEKCWAKTADITSYDEFYSKKDKKENEVILNKNFENFINAVKLGSVYKRPSFDKIDSSILKYFFKSKDLVYITKCLNDPCEEANDVYTLTSYKKVDLYRYEFMSMGVYENAYDKRNQANLKENRYVLIECDYLKMDLQLKFYHSLMEYGFPIKSIIYSGNDSLHCLIKINPIQDVKEYKQYCDDIYNELNKLAYKDENSHQDLVDKANKDGIRYTRLPYGTRNVKIGGNKHQNVIYCDMIEADKENMWLTPKDKNYKQDYKEIDVRGMFKEYVKNLVRHDEDAAIEIYNKKLNDEAHFIGNKCDIDYAIDKDKCTIEDVFQNNGNYYIKMKNIELQKISKLDLFDQCRPYIKLEIEQKILEMKDAKHQFLDIRDFYFPIKDIKFEVTLHKKSEIFNLYIPGFITECLDKKVTTIPSEFDKLLNNLADPKEKDWIINHLACHFDLIKNDFKKDGRDFVLETIPVFYGKSGTGKNTFLDVIGQAISNMGTRYISIGNIGDDFNEFYLAGAININEAANGRAERRASKEALKRFTDIYQYINIKFKSKIQILNTAYKSVSANESVFGVLDIDKFDRRFQYICGGEQLNGKENNVINLALFEKQKKDFISFLLNYDCDYDKAMTVFDNTPKSIDKVNSMSVTEQAALWIRENIVTFEAVYFTQKQVTQWFSEQKNEKFSPDLRIFGCLLSRYFEKKQARNSKLDCGLYPIKKGERYYINPRRKENGEPILDD